MWVNINDLKQCCKKEWDKIPPLLCERLITSYRKQFKFVLFFTWLCGLSHYLKAAFSFVFQKHQYFTDNLPCLLEENAKILDSTRYCFTIKTHSRPKKASLSNPTTPCCHFLSNAVSPAFHTTNNTSQCFMLKAVHADAAAAGSLKYIKYIGGCFSCLFADAGFTLSSYDTRALMSSKKHRNWTKISRPSDHQQ